MSTHASPDDLLPLTPAVFHILLALSEGDKHGYAIMKEVAQATEGRMQMGPGTLYGTISRMLSADLIEESDERPDSSLDDERRRYYRLTEFGAKVAAAETRRMSSLVKLARKKRILLEI
jgi:DNA-binding PadR family transcriptional regulator